MRLFYIIIFKDDFRYKKKTSKSTKNSGGQTFHVNLHEHAYTYGKTLIYGFPCSYILAACHFHSIDFRSLVQHNYNTLSYYNT